MDENVVSVFIFYAILFSVLGTICTDILMVLKMPSLASKSVVVVSVVVKITTKETE